MSCGETIYADSLETEEGKPVGQSKIAAREGITMVVLSRVGMAAPGNTRIV